MINSFSFLVLLPQWNSLVSEKSSVSRHEQYLLHLAFSMQSLFIWQLDPTKVSSLVQLDKLNFTYEWLMMCLYDDKRKKKLMRVCCLYFIYLLHWKYGCWSGLNIVLFLVLHLQTLVLLPFSMHSALRRQSSSVSHVVLYLATLLVNDLKKKR